MAMVGFDPDGTPQAGVADFVKGFKIGEPQLTEEQDRELDDIIGEPDPASDSRRLIRDAEEIEKEVAATRWDLRTLADLEPFDPDESHDPNILFRHNWLSLGQSFMLVATSGVGKSSMTVQMAYHWATGRAFLAEPMRPLKIAIIQGEDSDRDVQEQREGMRRGLIDIEGWSEDAVRLAEKSIYMPTDFIGYAGDKFISRLADFQRDNRFDLILINPLQSYFGGDVSSQEDVSHFCREGLDPIMKSKSSGCCIGLVAHTPKQKSGDRTGRSNVDDYGEYMMQGSAEWTNWARAVFSFLKSNKKDGLFDFAATKRGHVLRWKDNEGKRTSKRHFAHSDGFIYWQHVEDPAAFGNDAASFADEVRRLAEYIYEHGKVNRTMVKCNAGKIGITQRRYSEIFDDLFETAENYGLVGGMMRAGNDKTVQYIGRSEDFYS